MTERLSADELLIAHAAGRLPEPVALAVATHLALNPAVRSRYRRYEAFGGALLRGLEPARLAEGAWDRLLDRIEANAAEPPSEPADPSAGHDIPALPRQLRDYVPGPLNSLRWRHYGTAAEAEIPNRAPGYRTTLVRVRAGRAVPRHTHEGNELTVVLEGAFHDEAGHYRRGDLAIADGAVDHRPMADDGQDCLCLWVTDAPLRLTGRFGRLLNPFVRF
jgi:putative transcriptional regulator